MNNFTKMLLDRKECTVGICENFYNNGLLECKNVTADIYGIVKQRR